MSEEDAVDAAIREMREPDQVRDELESVHGHRALGATADRAAQKARTWFGAGTWPVIAAGAAAVLLLLDAVAV